MPPLARVMTRIGTTPGFPPRRSPQRGSAAGSIHRFEVERDASSVRDRVRDPGSRSDSRLDPHRIAPANGARTGPDRRISPIATRRPDGANPFPRPRILRITKSRNWLRLEAEGSSSAHRAAPPCSRSVADGPGTLRLVGEADWHHSNPTIPRTADGANPFFKGLLVVTINQNVVCVRSVVGCRRRTAPDPAPVLRGVAHEGPDREGLVPPCGSTRSGGSGAGDQGPRSGRIRERGRIDRGDRL